LAYGALYIFQAVPDMGAHSVLGFLGRTLDKARYELLMKIGRQTLATRGRVIKPVERQDVALLNCGSQRLGPSTFRDLRVEVNVILLHRKKKVLIQPFRACCREQGIHIFGQSFELQDFLKGHTLCAEASRLAFERLA
jgi:hypothetical protein